MAIITYEVGDTVELDDDVAVPYGLGAGTVQLVLKSPKRSIWIVDVIEAWSDNEQVGQQVEMHKKWFNLR